jgi:hypothetical protein
MESTSFFFSFLIVMIRLILYLWEKYSGCFWNLWNHYWNIRAEVFFSEHITRRLFVSSSSIGPFIL